MKISTRTDRPAYPGGKGSGWVGGEAGEDGSRKRNLDTGRKKGQRVRVTDEKLKQLVVMKDANRPVAEIARVLGLSRQTVYTVLKELE